MSIPGRQAHLDPSKIPPQDRDIHLVELKLCPGTNPSITLETAATQHAHTITRLKTRSSRKPKRNNKVTLHIILIGVAGTIYNEYMIKPLVSSGLSKHKGALGARWWFSGGGKSGRLGALPTTHLIPISSVSFPCLG
eukprot:1160491-Pelagomonas_calceolata.AAC.4